MEKKIVSVKVRPSAMFASVYYVGEFLAIDKGFTLIKNPVRFTETFVPQQVTGRGLDAAGKPVSQTVITPQTQSIEEAGISFEKHGIHENDIVGLSEITTESNKGLLDAYDEALKLRSASKAGLHLPESSASVN
jgi:predicted GNAT family acetyltransferase